MSRDKNTVAVMHKVITNLIVFISLLKNPCVLYVFVWTKYDQDQIWKRMFTNMLLFLFNYVNSNKPDSGIIIRAMFRDEI